MADLFGYEPPATQPPDGAEGQEKRDAYYTPDPLALACTRNLRLAGVDAHTILEPGCGGGAFLRAVADVYPRATAVGIDLVPACEGPGSVRRQDIFDPELRGPFDLAIGNPPFSIAPIFIRRTLELVREGGHVAFYLPIGFSALAGNVRLFRENPLSYFWPVVGRPSFTGDGQCDFYEYAFFVWRKGARLPGRIMGPLEWKR